MAKVVKKKKKGLGSLRGASGGAGGETSSLRPKLVEKKPPCMDGCPNENQIRKAIVTIAQAEKMERPLGEAIEEAWHIFTETQPFPSICGRVCPHPCESACNRKEKDAPVGINNLERFIGDYGLAKKLMPRKLTDETREEKIAIVGSGPGGLSCAYHLARLGYPVTVFEAFPKAGGMLRYGIPDYRLPPEVLDGEIQRLVDMGVEIKTDCMVGKDIAMDELRSQFKSIFVALGAHKGRLLRVEGEDAPNVFTGTDFLHRANEGEALDIGDKVVVIGGGDTAVDAARVALRLGASATILYRRTRQEMPAIDEEIFGADEEKVTIHYLAAPIEIYKDDQGRAVGMKCQQMELGEPDASGRRRPVPIEGETFDLEFTALIAAISQEPDFTGFENFIEGRDWIKVDEKFKTKEDGVYSGGDNINLGIAIDAIYHGRSAAAAIHEYITGEPIPGGYALPLVKTDKMKLEYYPESQPVKADEMEVADRLKSLELEIKKTLSEEDAVIEAKRCMSCGMCFDCGTCWSLCQDQAVVKPLVKGQPYVFKLDFCTGCSKCAENCPCGYIEMH